VHSAYSRERGSSCFRDKVQLIGMAELCIVEHFENRKVVGGGVRLCQPIPAKELPEGRCQKRVVGME
jgi:hypothetical protein